MIWVFNTDDLFAKNEYLSPFVSTYLDTQSQKLGFLVEKNIAKHSGNTKITTKQ